MGGKGGVGKTTCAAACAVAAARRGLHTLAISVDPAHSLGDALGVRLGRLPRDVPGLGGRLKAAELQASAVIRTWLSERRDLVEEIAARGTWLDRDDVSALVRLSLPGIDEVAALLEVGRFVRSRRYDLVVVDTAPTGHSLRMLDTPDVLGAIASTFDAMQSRHRAIVEAIRGQWSGDDADTLVAELDRDSRELAAMLRDAGRTSVFWVTLPEPMAVDETLDALRALTSRSIPIEAVVVNRLTPRRPDACQWCDARRRFEAHALDQLERVPRGATPLTVVSVLDRAHEPVGIRNLGAIGNELEGRRARPPRREGQRQTVRAMIAAPTRSRSRVAAGRDRGTRARHSSDVRFPEIEGTSARVLMFGGKGGVGKTTCAAGAALAIARAHPDRKVLLLSTDPAHSLSDVLAVRVSDEAARVRHGPANLDVRELDAVTAFARVRQEYASAIDQLFGRLRLNSAVDAAYDRRVMQGLLEFAPPGVDELMAMSDVVETIGAEKGAYDVLVMDTAPTGHALRLLEMPTLVQDWSRALMRVLLKYRSVTGVGAPGEALLRLSRAMGRIQSILTDRAAAEFIVVTRPAALPRAETQRLLATLRRMRIPVSRLVINAANAGTCPRCRRIATSERREVATLVRSLRSGITVTTAPAEIPPPHGVRGLLRWQRRWESSVHGSG